MSGQIENFAQRLDGFDEFVNNAMKDWKVPGMAISIIKDEEMIYSRGFGLRDPQNNLEMNADTLYRIASNTKAFTAMSLAILVDEGKMEWDKPVRHYIPSFKLFDTYASEHVTPRDLLCHRTGLPSHDGALDDRNMSRREIVEHFRYLEPSCDIRTRLQYNNWMYMLAGHLVECVAGDKWEHFVQERIFNPIGMKNSNFSFIKSRKTGNYAECFYEKAGELIQYRMHKEFDPDFVFPRAPAGAINSSANEMANWVILQLNKGKFEGRQIVSEAGIYEMHSPNMIDNWNSPYDELGESSCGLGWFIWSYRGHKLVLHGGFFGSQVYLMPKQKIGVVVLPTFGSELPGVAAYNIFDRLLGLDEIPWNRRKMEETVKAKEKEQEEKHKAISHQKTGQNHHIHWRTTVASTSILLMERLRFLRTEIS
jgi:CubicO group peptidase (beta-lactamase class C family)